MRTHHRDTENTEDAQRKSLKSLCPLCVLCVSVVNDPTLYTQLKILSQRTINQSNYPGITIPGGGIPLIRTPAGGCPMLRSLPRVRKRAGSTFFNS